MSEKVEIGNNINNINNINSPPIRIITAGSVDDGKSTLIGRLLYDCQAVLTDQLQSLSRSRHVRVKAEDADIDLSLLTDGLSAEREQGITIDVAYRYFATAERKFILADAPGHEQYTRNLVTGASQASVAVILVDATRIDTSQQPVKLLAQTKRHSTILSRLGFRHVVFVVNKMDLCDYRESHFRAIETALVHLQKQIGFSDLAVIPISALKGEGVVHPHKNMAWYRGKTLLAHLQNIDFTHELFDYPARFAVQYVARVDGDSAEDFRGYLGKLSSGTLKQGERVRILPSGLTSTIKTIYHSGSRESQQQVKAGSALAIELSDDLDISRGDLIVSANDKQPQLKKQITADICWLDNQPLSLSRKYLLRINTKTLQAKVNKINQVWDVETLSQNSDHQGITANDLGEVEIQLQSEIAVEDFQQCRTTGAFILIDGVTLHTVAAGMIKGNF